MKFQTGRTAGDASSIFMAIIGDVELADVMRSNSYMTRFMDEVMTRLANMIAAYFFKQKRNDLAALVQDEKFQQLLAKTMVDRLIDNNQYGE